MKVGGSGWTGFNFTINGPNYVTAPLFFARAIVSVHDALYFYVCATFHDSENGGAHAQQQQQQRHEIARVEGDVRACVPSPNDILILFPLYRVQDTRHTLLWHVLRRNQVYR